MFRKKLKRIFLIIGILLFIVVLFSETIFYFRINQKDAKTLANEVLIRCQDKDKNTCYAQEFGLLTKKYSYQVVIDTLQYLQQIDPAALACHLIAHKIANEAVAKNPEDWLKILRDVQYSGCSQGFFHGVIEGYTRFHPDFVLDKTTIPVICKQIGYTIQGDSGHEEINTNCVHTVGHVILVQEDANIQNAVKVCSSLSSNYQYECSSGVFMENENRENLLVHGLARAFPWTYENAQLEKNLCKTFRGIAANACYHDVGEMLAVFAKDPASLYQLCSGVPEKSDLIGCFSQGMGFYAYNLLAQHKSVVLESLCDPVANEQSAFVSCIQYVVSYAVNYDISTFNMLSQYCSGVKSVFQDTCFTTLAQRIRVDLQKEKRGVYCAKLPSKYSSSCF